MPHYPKKLEEDLEAAKCLLRDWTEKPAAVFVKYGLADREDQVKLVSPTTPKGKPGHGVKTLGYCGCCCSGMMECEWEREEN